MLTKINIGIIITSDRASKGLYKDLSGEALKNILKLYIKNEINFEYRLIPDEYLEVVASFKELILLNCSLIFTSGGTGPAKRDITVEATEAICQKMLPGFGELMRAESFKYVSTAILSRQTAGTVGSTLIVNLPGKPQSIEQCLKVVFPAIPYCVDLIEGPYIEANKENITIFRPAEKKI
ncbi:MAG: molybdopterin adenylyltransferase [Solirubrobacteraceae bacterium]